MVKLDYGEVEFLFTGDCEEKCEKTLVNTEALDVDVYKVGHHGSRTSSTDYLLSEVTPETAIISAGLNNRYRHPHPEALERILQYTEEIYSTAVHGTVIVTTDGTTYSIMTQN